MSGSVPASKEHRAVGATCLGLFLSFPGRPCPFPTYGYPTQAASFGKLP